MISPEAFDAACAAYSDVVRDVVLALPMPPVLLATPTLVRALLPFVRFEQQVASFDLLRHYMIASWVLRTELDGTADAEHLLSVDVASKAAQWDVLHRLPDDAPGAQTLAYVHAYEKGLVKYMYLARGEEPDVLRAILCMNASTVAALRVDAYLCKEVVDVPNARVDALVEQQRVWRTQLDALVDGQEDHNYEQAAAALRALAVEPASS